MSGANIPVQGFSLRAGLSVPAPIDQDGFEAAWALTLAVNLTAYTRTIRAALAHALGLKPEQGMAITVSTLSVSVIEHVKGGLLRGRGGAWRVVGVNRPAG
mgnify:CR=1 FL=1